jgi:hypothetical protein
MTLLVLPFVVIYLHNDRRPLTDDRRLMLFGDRLSAVSGHKKTGLCQPVCVILP